MLLPLIELRRVTFSRWCATLVAHRHVDDFQVPRPEGLSAVT